MTKHLRLLLLLFLLAWPVHAQTGPGNIQPASPAIGNAQNAITTNGTGTAINVQNYGAAVYVVTITGTGTPVISFKARTLSSGSYTARNGYLKTDSTKTLVSTTSTSGEYYVDCAGDYDAIGPVTGTWTGTVTVTIKGVPATARVGAPSGGGVSGSGTSGQFALWGASTLTGDSDATFSGDTSTFTKTIIGAGSAITSSGPGGALGSNAFTSTSYMPLAGGTFTGDVTHSGAAIIISGNISTAAWTTSGVRIKGTPGTLTDTTSSGTVATAYTDVLGGNTIAASSATTFTNYFTQYNKDPIAGTNVALTNKWALGGDSLKVGTSNPLTVSNAGVLNATSPVFVTPTLGAATATSINGNILTAGTYTLTGTAAKTLNFTNSIVLTAGADGTTQTFPSTSATIARTDAGQTFTGTQAFSVITASSTITSPTLVGGSATSGQTLELRTSSGNSTSGDYIKLTGKNNGATEFGRVGYGSNGEAELLIGSSTFYNQAGFGVLSVSGSSGATLTLRAAGTLKGEVYYSSSQFHVASSAAEALSIETGYIPQVVITHTASANRTLRFTGSNGGNPTISASAGSVALGSDVTVTTTTDSTTTTSGALQVAGGAAIRKRVFIDGITTSSGLQTAVLCQSSGGEMIADSVACLASSGRFKQDIKPLIVGLDEVMRLRPVSYRYKQEGIFAHNANYLGERVGLIAEDVAAVDKRFVGYEADGKTVRTVSYETMVPLLVKSIQELKGEVDALRAEIQSLKQPRRIAFHLPSVIGL